MRNAGDTNDSGFLRHRMPVRSHDVRFREKVVYLKKAEAMNAIVLFILLCALGALCYWFYFKCVDWFEKI